ncbi:hypothetical protein DNK03_08140 [Brucella anthropi]|uniref:glycoside hydrolase family protein n=1 Tax=Brucella anthropi TaxID=529 RepID=UPI000DECEE3E|nr:hypothetical protein [Brucella anthropi]RCI79527.1 hypothetical protein DNK03_08140 [Brucella anthropi]
MQIADAMGTLGTKFEEQAVIKAEQEGADAVYRDENGTLQMDQRSNWSKSGQAYNRAAQQAYAARVSGDVRTKGQELFNAAKGDISAFDASWKGFSDQLLSNTPKEYRGPLKTMLETEGSRLGLGVSEQKRKRDLSIFENDIKTEIQFLDNDMAALARAGGTGTPDYLEKQSQLQSLYKELVDNPEFTVSEKQAQMELQRVESRHMSEAVVGNIDKTLATGGVKAAQKEAERILTDEKLHLSPAERRQYAGLAEQRISGFVAEQKVALKPIQDQATKYKKLLDEGVGLDNPDIDMTIANLARGGDVAGALDLQAKRRAALTIQQFNLASPESRVDALERGRAAANGVRSSSSPNLTGVAYPGGGSGSGNLSLDVIRKHEGFRENPYWDVNAFRVGYGSDTITAADGSPVRVTKGMKVSREDAERDLTRRVGEFQQGIRQDIGGENWGALSENTKAALTSVAYNYGSLPKSVVAAAKSGDPEAIATAIEGLRGHNEGINAGRRQEEANLVRNGAPATSTASVDPEVIKAYRTGVTQDAKDLWSDMKGGISKGIPPAANELSLLTRQLSVIDDPSFRREVTSYLTSEDAAAMFASMPPQQAASVLDELKADAGDGATVAQQQIMEAADRTAKRVAEAMKNDPIGYAAQRQWAPNTPTIDLAAGPDAVGAAFAARQQTVDLLQARGMVQPGTSALRPQDKAVLNQVMTQGTPGEQATLFGAMSKNLSMKTYMATMADLAGDANARTSASAGALYQYNPQVAEGVLRGQALVKENPNYAPKKTDDNQASIDDILPPQAFGAGLEASRQTLLDSARARYADLSNTAGDTSGEFNEDRMTQAVNEVTGGMIDFNGQSIIAPRYGMNQEDFDKMMYSLSDDYLSDAITELGQQITASDLRRYGRLRAVGHGRYLVDFGKLGVPAYALSKPVLGDRVTEHVSTGTFVLDLRNDESLD